MAMLKIRLRKSAASAELYRGALGAFGDPVTVGHCAVWPDVEVLREAAGLRGDEAVVLWTARTPAGQDWLSARVPAEAVIVSPAGPGLTSHLGYKAGASGC